MKKDLNNSTLIILFVLSIPNIILCQKSISGAFGIELGAKFDTTSIIGKGSLTDGTPMYMFEPEKPFRSFSKYYVLITPKTNKVYGIWGIGEIDSDPMCTKEQDLLMAILNKKYGETDDQGLMSTIVDAKTITIGERYITSKCSGYSDVTIDIRYYDENLKSISEKERIEIESEKLDSSGL